MAKADIVITPSIFERITFQDNLFLKDLEAFEFRTEGALATQYKTERTQLSLKGKLTDFRYVDSGTNYDENGNKIKTDRYDRSAYDIGSNASWSVSERLRLNLGGNWLQDDSVDSYWDSSAQERSYMVSRDRYSASAGLEYNVTEVSQLSFNFSYAALSYDKKIQGFSDYEMLNSSMNYNHFLFDGSMAIISQLSWQRINFDSPEAMIFDWGFLGNLSSKQDVTQDVYRGMLGLRWMPTDNVTINVMAGTNHTRSKTELDIVGTGLHQASTSSNINRSSNSGFTGMFDVAWTHPTGTLSFAINQEFLPSTGGSLRKTTDFTLRNNYRFSEKLNLYNILRYQIEKNDDTSLNKLDREFWSFYTQFSYKVTGDFSLRLAHSYLHRENNINDRVDRANTVSLQFVYEFSKHINY